MLYLDYSPENRKAAEDILGRLHLYRDFWKGIAFQTKEWRYDLDKLKQLCLEKEYAIDKFQTEPPQTFWVTVGNWTSKSLNLTFINQEKPLVGIESSFGYLDEKFYSVLNPKDVFDVFGPALVSNKELSTRPSD